jgi:hypothetical protein
LPLGRPGADHDVLHSIATTLTRPRWPSFVARRPLVVRWAPIVAILGFGAILLIPNWIVLPPDDEGLFLVINPTLFQAQHLFTDYPLWNPFVEFGGPQPGSQSLIFHPFVIVAHFASPAFSIALLYQVQFWIGLLATWAVCRYLRLHRWVSAACVFTFALCSLTYQLLSNFWPDLWVAWTLSPLLLFLVLKLLDGETRRARAFYSVAAGLCAALMVLDGHLGVAPTLGIGFVAFLAGTGRRATRVWPWLGAAVLVLVCASGTRVFDIALENARSTSPHYQQVYPFDFAHFLFYPISLGAEGPRNVAFGGPFVGLALVALLWVGHSSRFAWGVRIAALASFVAWFLPVAWIPAASGNWLYGQPLTLFSIFLAGFGLQRLWERFPRLRAVLVAVVGLQMAILAYGFYRDVYDPDLQRARSYLSGDALVPTLKSTFKEQEIYRYFERRPDHSATRVLLTDGARERLWRTMTDYQWPAWGWHGLRLVNGQFRGVDVSEFQQTKEALHGEIRGEPGLWDEPDDLVRAQGVLDVLNVGYVLARPDERVAGSLVPVHRFHVPAGRSTGDALAATDILVYRNPVRWGDAVVVSQDAKSLDSFAQRPACRIPGLLCDDVSPILGLRSPGGVTAQRWSDRNLDVRLAASTRPRVLMVSQLYRPGWRAKLSDGRTVDGYRLFGAVTGFDIPPGVRSAQVYFHPTARIAFAALSWVTVLLSLVFLAGAAALGWPRRGSL